MRTFVLATNAPQVSEILCDYLAENLAADDTVHAVNSQRGGDATDAEAVQTGEEALEVVADRLSDRAAVETHQRIRNNPPAEDVLAIAEEVAADELVIGIRKRTATSRLVFGSVAQDIFRQSDLPMRVVPRE